MKDIYLLAMVVLDVLWLVLALYGLPDAIIAADHPHIHVTVGCVEPGLVLVVHRHQRTLSSTSRLTVMVFRMPTSGRAAVCR